MVKCIAFIFFGTVMVMISFSSGTAPLQDPGHRVNILDIFKQQYQLVYVPQIWIHLIKCNFHTVLNKNNYFFPIYVINRFVCAVQTMSDHQTIALKEKKWWNLIAEYWKVIFWHAAWNRLWMCRNTDDKINESEYCMSLNRIRVTQRRIECLHIYNTDIH
jgi:hypothetical protein